MHAFRVVHGLDMPMFPNLVKFVIGLQVFGGWSMMHTIFNKMPNLEHITYSDVSLRGYKTPSRSQKPPTMIFNVVISIVVNFEVECINFFLCVRV
ncbi:hypothetical protein Hanom_Chr01g00085121 [Helianthus anomalus]